MTSRTIDLDLVTKPIRPKRPNAHVAKFKAFVRVHVRRRKLEEQLRHQKELERRAAGVLMTDMKTVGETSRYYDGRTVSIVTTEYAVAKLDRVAIVQALKDCGWGDLVSENYSIQSVSAKVRRADAVPEGLRDAFGIEVSESLTVRPAY